MSCPRPVRIIPNPHLILVALCIDSCHFSLLSVPAGPLESSLRHNVCLVRPESRQVPRSLPHKRFRHFGNFKPSYFCRLDLGPVARDSLSELGELIGVTGIEVRVGELGFVRSDLG